MHTQNLFNTSHRAEFKQTKHNYRQIERHRKQEKQNQRINSSVTLATESEISKVTISHKFLTFSCDLFNLVFKNNIKKIRC